MLLRAFDKTVRRKPLAGCGGRGVLWELNRFRPGSHCKKGSYGETLLLMLIKYIAPPIQRGHPNAGRSVGQDHRRLRNTRGSVRRASGFVLTSHTESIRSFFCISNEKRANTIDVAVLAEVNSQLHPGSVAPKLN